MECYNYSSLRIKNRYADTAAIKIIGESGETMLFQFEDGECVIDTANFKAGMYALQLFQGEDVIDEEQLEVRQNLKHAGASYDPRSKARKILDAIDAYLAGTASHQQRRVKVGDKEIQYSSYQELMKWRNFYAKLVEKEKGKVPQIRHEKLYYRGV